MSPLFPHSFYRIARAVFPAAAICLFVACGTPNPFEFQNDLPPPREVSARFNGSTLTIKISGFYAESGSPDFSGYNIYVDRVATPATIRERLVLGETGSKPTLASRPSSNLITNEITLSRWWVTNTTTGTTSLDPFAPQDTYFVIVTSWAGRANQESGNQLIQEIRIPLWLEGQQAADNTTYQQGPFQVTFTASQLTPVAGTAILAMGPTGDWSSVFGAPLAGYMAAPQALAPSNLFYLYAQSNFAKLWVSSQSGGITQFRWAMAVGSPLL